MRWISALCCGLAVLLSGETAAAQTPSSAAHPLDPLRPDEITTAVTTLRAAGKITDASRLPLIALREPDKASLLDGARQRTVPREAFVIAYERASGHTFEAIVDVDSKVVRSWREVPGVQPLFMREDDQIMQDTVRADPAWQDAIRKRGITDFQKVQLDPWSAGNFGFPDEAGRRIFRAVPFYKGDAMTGYARPIEGLVAYVDVNARKVIKLVDSGVVPVATAIADYSEQAVGRLRESPRPLHIVQPGGASFDIRGHEVHWQNWRFRYAMHPREGLVLHTVSYEDQGKVRPVLYRAALSEMVVPYGDPSASWFFRNAFDEGEYGIGNMADSLEQLTDAPENATFLDAVFADEKGGVIELPHALALFERDGGLLWKHFDVNSQHNESRRARDLVLSWIATVGNYEYAFGWVFHQDGTLEMEMGLTGIMQTKGVALPGAASHDPATDHAHLVAPGVAAVHHQHFFNFRIDMDVDGTTNKVFELDTASAGTGPDNPYMNAITTHATLLTSEQQARRQWDLAANRRWKIASASQQNGLGQPTGYLLVPGDNAVPYADPRSAVRQRAGFLSSHLWVTPFDPSEMYAAGDYVYQSAGGDGLVKWVKANRPLVDQDVVIWYTMGITHIPRPEDWPVMPVHHTGFKLMPNGFFDRNPSLDVARPVTTESNTAGRPD